MKKNGHEAHTPASPTMTESHYRQLGLMVALSFIAMYILMYVMVNSLDNVVTNFNQAYMAGLMAAPMVLIELAVMRSMYRSRRLNAIFAASALALAIASFVLIRQQVAIGDRQFLRSMIPHHAGAILMCQRAALTSAEIKELCERPDGIVASQQAEIAQMKAWLDRGIAGR